MTARRVGERKRIAVEQRFALGDLPEEIAARLDVRLTDVLRVGEAMDAAAREHKQPLHAQPPPGRRSHRKRGEDACTACSNARAEYMRAHREKVGTAYDKAQGAAYRTASARLREAHRDEFDRYCREELAKITLWQAS